MIYFMSRNLTPSCAIHPISGQTIFIPNLSTDDRLLRPSSDSSYRKPHNAIPHHVQCQFSSSHRFRRRQAVTLGRHLIIRVERL